MEQPSASSPKQNQSADRSKIADRVRKLLAKAAGTENEAEAMAFNEKAHAMLLEHNLSMTDVHQKETEDEEVELDSSLESHPHRWRRELGVGVSDLYMCEYFYDVLQRPNAKKTKYYTHNFIGKPSNIMVAKVMLVYLMDTVERLAQQGAKTVPEKERSPYRGAFRDKCVGRIRHRITSMLVAAKAGGFIKTESGTTLPALLSLYEKAEVENKQAKEALATELGTNFIVPRKTSAADLHAKGARDGEEAGEKIGLDQQVGVDKTKRIANK